MLSSKQLHYVSKTVSFAPKSTNLHFRFSEKIRLQEVHHLSIDFLNITDNFSEQFNVCDYQPCRKKRIDKNPTPKDSFPVTASISGHKSEFDPSNIRRVRSTAQKLNVIPPPSTPTNNSQQTRPNKHRTRAKAPFLFSRWK